MKIIKEGKLPETYHPWPTGFSFDCWHCNCRFKVEPGDTFLLECERRPNGTKTLRMICPQCSVVVTAYVNGEPCDKKTVFQTLSSRTGV